MNTQLKIALPELSVLFGGEIPKGSIIFLVSFNEVSSKTFIYNAIFNDLDGKNAAVLVDATTFIDQIKENLLSLGYLHNGTDNVRWVDYYSWKVKPHLSAIEEKENTFYCSKDVSWLLLAVTKSITQLKNYDTIKSGFFVFPSFLMDIAEDTAYNKITELFAKLKEAKVTSFFSVTDTTWERLKNIGIPSLVDYEIWLRKTDAKKQIKINKSFTSTEFDDWLDFSSKDKKVIIDISKKAQELYLFLDVLFKVYNETIKCISDATFQSVLSTLSKSYDFLSKVDLKKSIDENMLRLINTTTLSYDESTALIHELIDTLFSSIQTAAVNTLSISLEAILNDKINSISNETVKSKILEILFKLQLKYFKSQLKNIKQ